MERLTEKQLHILRQKLCEGYIWKYTNSMEKQIPKKPIFQFNLSDTVSRFECKCGKIIKVRHDIGIMDNNDAPNYCDNCGQKLDWSNEE